MKTSVRLIIMSHLSDLQEGGSDSYQKMVPTVNFIKWMLLRHKDITVEVDPDQEFAEFQVKEKIRLAKHITNY